jgi:hypothetical protein
VRAALALFLTLGAAGPVAEDYTTPPPDVVADVSRWELVSGTFRNENVEGSFRFYVNPERAALYQLMRYRVRFVDPGTELESRYRAVEKLVWNAHPGERLPLRSFEHTAAAEGRPAGWREMRHGDREYHDEMAVLIMVLSLHRGSSSTLGASPAAGGGPGEWSP